MKRVEDLSAQNWNLWIVVTILIKISKFKMNRCLTFFAIRNKLLTKK